MSCILCFTVVISTECVGVIYVHILAMYHCFAGTSATVRHSACDWIRDDKDKMDQ